MSYRINTEEYYQRYIDLQEKLRKSEEERLKLEIRLNKMMQIIQTEEQRHYDNLSLQYKQFWEEDKKRQDRNNYILRILDRVEHQSEALEEKARRLSMIRDQYYGMSKRHYDDTRPSYLHQPFYDNDSCNQSPERDIMYSGVDMKEYNMNKNFNIQHQEKMEYLNRYLENIDSNKTTDKNTSSMKSQRSYRSSKSPTYNNNNTNLKLDDFKPTTDFGYKTENFLTNRYSYQKLNDDEDSETSSRNESPRYAPTSRNRSKSPNVISKIDMERNNIYPDFEEGNSRIPRYRRRISRRDQQAPKKIFSTDYKNSLQKLQKIQENSRKILSQHIPKTNYNRNQNINYNRRLQFSYPNDLSNYPVASDFGLNMNDIYQPDKVIQKYLIEKYNTYLSDRYLGYNPNPFDSYHDRMMYDNLPQRSYQSHRRDYIRNSPDRYESTSNIPNNYYMHPKSPRTYDGTHLTTGDIPPLKKLDDQHSKLPKSNYVSGSDNASHKFDDVKKDEKPSGIHFNDSDQILEYDKNKPSSEYNKKYELNKNWKDDDDKLDVNSNEKDSTLQQTEDNDKDEDTSLSPTSPLSYEDALNLNRNVSPLLSCNDQIDSPIKSESALQENNTYTSPKEQPIVGEDIKINGYQDQIKESTPPVERKTPRIDDYKSPDSENPPDKGIDIDSNVNILPILNDVNVGDIEKSNDILTPESPEIIENQVNPILAADEHTEEVNKSQEIYEETNDQLNQDSALSKAENNESDEMHDANGQGIQYDENGQTIQYDENAQQIQYDENHQPIQHGQPIQYGQNGQEIQYDQNGQPVHYDESGQPIQYDPNEQQYDENGQPIQYDQNGQPLQYDQNGQPIQYDQNGQPIQYDESGQPIQYDENGIPIQYDQSGQPIQYDQNGQPIQYDETGQPVQYDENGQLIQYDQSGQYDDNGQAIQYDESGQPIAYTAEPYNQDYGQAEDVPDESQKAAQPQTNVFDMLDTDTESIKQDTKVSNDSDFELTT